MISLAAALVVSALTFAQPKAEEPAALAAGSWVKCVDVALSQTNSMTDYEMRLRQVMASCSSHENDLRRIMVEAVQSSGADSSSPEAVKAIDDSMAGMREKIRERVERGLSASPLTIWNGLQSGMSSEAAAQELARRGLRAKLGKPDADGWSVLRVKERVPVAGHKATVELSFFRDRLFWSEVAYSFVTSDEQAYGTLIKALSELYGEPVTNNYLPNIAHASTAGVVFR